MDAVLAQLGVVSDSRIALLVGKSVNAVIRARRKRGIPSMGRPKAKAEESLEILGTKPDSQIGRELGVSLHAVYKVRKAHGITAYAKRRPWTPEEVALFGKLSDAEIGRRTGRSQSAVKLERTNRRIPGIDPGKATFLNRLAKAGKI